MDRELIQCIGYYDHQPEHQGGLLADAKEQNLMMSQKKTNVNKYFRIAHFRMLSLDYEIIIWIVEDSRDC